MRRALRRLLLGMVLLAPADLQATTLLLKTQPGSVVHWSQPVITVGIDGSTPSRTASGEDVKRALELAARAWNAVEAEQPRLSLATDSTPDVNIRFCRGRWQGDTVDLGRSKFVASLRDGTVTQATVEINECDHGFSGPGQRTGYGLEAVLTHELGHVLGLGHSDNASAIMYPTGDGTSARGPSLEDQTALALIYLGRASGGTSPPAPADREKWAAAPAHASVNASLRSSELPDAVRIPSGAVAYQGPPGLPPDSVSVLSFKTRAGRNVMVYTCEPTMLPPIEGATVDPETNRHSGRRGRTNHRAVP